MATSRTKPSTPRLSEAARHLVYPEGIVRTSWPRIEARLADMAIRYDAWQSGAVRLILGRDKADRYVATVGGVTMSIPRQVGKTFTIGSLLIALCVEYPGLRVVWTSHHLRTTTNTFRAMQGMVRRKRIRPYLAPNGIRTANGEQEVRFANGSIIMFGAREHGFGVGIDAIDVLVCDEAQRLSSKSLADMVPTTNQARHAHGALLFLIGTPPRPTDAGEEFSARRQKALDGKMTNGIYIEFGADPDADLDDAEQWRKANPSYPQRTPHESMLRMRENLTDDNDWRREAMGIWDAEGASFVIDPTTWERYSDPASMAIDRLALAIDVSPDRSVSTVALAGQRADELWHVEAYDQRRGTAWVAEYVRERCERNTIRAVVVDGTTQAATLIDELQQAGVKVTVTATRDACTASASFVEQVYDAKVRHTGQPLLNASNGAAGKRPLYNGEAWVWAPKHPDLDITPTRAVSLALWGAQTSTVKKPTRKRTGGRRVVTA